VQHAVMKWVQTSGLYWSKSVFLRNGKNCTIPREALDV